MRFPSLIPLARRSPWSTFHRPSIRKPLRAQLCLEPLEERALLSGGSQLLTAAKPDAIVPGFASQMLPGNDDGSTAKVSLGFTVNFFGVEYDSLFVNNNGNVTFDSSLPEYTPFNLSSTHHVIIAPFFGDVDTRVGNVVTYGTGTIDGHKAFGVNWPDVGYYRVHTNKLNDFQLLLIDRSDTGPGNFDIEFNYGQIQWETGDASEGINGVGGFSARVGFSNGTQKTGTSFELPGSAVNGAFLDGNTKTGLINNSLNSPILGQYLFLVREGVPQTHPSPTPAPTPSPTPTPAPTTSTPSVDPTLAIELVNADVAQNTTEAHKRATNSIPLRFLLNDDKTAVVLPFLAPESKKPGDQLNGFALSQSAGQAQPLGSISGRVFEDYDGNGLQGLNEPGLAGQVVFLDLNGNGYMDDNEPRTVTNEKGEYRFLGLTPGTYRVRQVIWNNVEPTQPPSGERMVSLSLQRNAVSDQNFGAVQRTAAVNPSSVPLVDRPKQTGQSSIAETPAGLSPGDTPPLKDQTPPVTPKTPITGPGRKEVRLDPHSEAHGPADQASGLFFGSASAIAALWWGFVSPRQERKRMLSGRASQRQRANRVA
jgi:hypothetical protein